jgi:hypothetical protein
MRRPRGHFLAIDAALALAGGSTEPFSIPGRRSTCAAGSLGGRVQWPTQMDRPRQ